jgi:hypothetical protein
VAPQTVSYYVIPAVDKAGSTSYRDGTLTVQVTQATCNPHASGSGQCVDQTTIEQCTQQGEYGAAKACVGCNNGACSGDTCNDATSIPVDGTEYTYDLNPSVYNNDYDIDGASCRDSSFDDSPGPEAVFSIDASEGDVLEASWDHDDPSFYLVDDCSAVSSGGCLKHIESASDEEVGFTHKFDSAGMYYLMADVDDASSTDYRDGTLTAKVTKEQCDPTTYSPTCDGSGNLEWCNSLGLFDTYSCDGGCSNGSCGTPRGGICADAVSVQDGDTVSSKYNGVSSLDPVGNNSTGNCSFGEGTGGADFIYQVDLAGGEKLTASYDGQSGSTGSDSSDDLMYLLKDCSDESTCEESVNSDGSLTYTAASGGETVYVVMDHDRYTDEPSDSGGYGFNLDITINSSP